MEGLTDISLWQLVSLVLLVWIVVVRVQQRYFSPISDIPGPWFSSFGTIWQLWHVFKGDTNKAILGLHEKHGPLVRISSNEVSINHPDALTKVLAAPIRKGDLYKNFGIPNAVKYNNLMSERDPQRHVAMRANVASGYTLSNIIKNEPYVDKTISLMEERIDQVIQENVPVDFSKWIHFVSWDLLGELTFSRRFGFLDEARDVGNAISNTFALAFYITCAGYTQSIHSLLLGNPILRWIDFQPDEHTYQICVASVNKRKADEEARVDMVEQWMITRAKYPERMEEKEVFCAAAANLGAGGDTVAIVLQAFFYHLLRDPTCYSRLRREIDSANASGELSAVVSYAETQNLPYFQACIKEALRIFPSVPWNLPRIVPKEGITVAGHHFSSGTILSVNPYITHRNELCFGSDAHVYNPERWLEKESKSLEKYLIPFGLGYNSCPGRNAALFEMNKISATLVRDFDIQLVNPEREWQYHALFITVPHGWPCYLKRRNVPTE